jgi:hypothetical protein
VGEEEENEDEEEEKAKEKLQLKLKWKSKVGKGRRPGVATLCEGEGKERKGKERKKVWMSWESYAWCVALWSASRSR